MPLPYTITRQCDVRYAHTRSHHLDLLRFVPIFLVREFAPTTVKDSLSPLTSQDRAQLLVRGVEIANVRLLTTVETVQVGMKLT